MKTKIYSLLVALMSVVAFSACDDWTPGEQGGYPANTGGVSSANMNVAVNDEVTAIGRAIVDTSGFLVTVYEKGTGTVATYDGKACSWTYGAMPEIFTLPVGEYTVRVRSHEPEDAAWSAPYFVGAADFSVENDKVTYIGTVTCEFASVKVEVKFSKDLAQAMESDAKVVVDGGVAGTSLTWTAAETRYGYFFPAEDNPTILATFTGTVKGQQVSAIKEITDAKFGSYYIFTFSLNTGNPILPDEFGNVTEGTPGISIDFDVIDSPVSSTVRPGETPSGDGDKHPDTEEWPEEPTPPGPENPDNPDDPKDEVITIKSDDLKLGPDGDNDPGAKSHLVKIAAENGISHINVKIESTNEGFMESAGEMLPMEFDLANVEGETAKKLSSIGFKVNEEVIGQPSIDFDISNLAPLLVNFHGTHTFTLTVTDAKGNTKSETLIYIAEEK